MLTFSKKSEDPEADSKKEKLISRVPSKLAVEKQIEIVLRDKTAFDEMKKLVTVIKTKRRDRYMRLSGNIDYIDRNRNLILFTAQQSHAERPSAFDDHRKTVIAKREQVEEEDLRKKFLNTHRTEINQHHVLSKRLL